MNVMVEPESSGQLSRFRDDERIRNCYALRFAELQKLARVSKGFSGDWTLEKKTGVC